MQYIIIAFVSNLFYSVIMIVGGRFMWKRCANRFNSFCGYRSVRSTVNGDTWKFANEDCGKRWWKLGWITLLPSIALDMICLHADESTVNIITIMFCIVGCTVLVVSFIPTEMALKKNFTDDGKRKNDG